MGEGNNSSEQSSNQNFQKGDPGTSHNDKLATKTTSEDTGSDCMKSMENCQEKRKSPDGDFNVPNENAVILDLDLHCQNNQNRNAPIDEIFPGFPVENVPVAPTTTTTNGEKPKKRKERKRRERRRRPVPCPDAWKANIRKKSYQSGQGYISRRGKYVPPKQIVTTKDCLNSCKFKCTSRVTVDERQSIFKAYYSLSQNEKYYFIAATTERSLIRRTTKPGEVSRRGYTFQYFFRIRDEKIRVCKQFYLGTLNISQKPVYNVHKNKDEISGIPKKDQRGSNSSRGLPEDMKNVIRRHIESFPAVELHNSCSSFSRKYLPSHLNLAKLYDLYCEECKLNGLSPAKKSMYRFIFFTEYNLDFLKAKSRQKKEASTAVPAATSEEQKTDYQEPVQNKIIPQDESEKNKDKDTPMTLGFHLENTISCPRPDINPFF